MSAYFKKQERAQVNNLTLHMKGIEKEQTKPKFSKKKEIQRSEQK